MQKIKKAAAAFFGWGPLLTFIYPGFDSGSLVLWFRSCMELIMSANVGGGGFGQRRKSEQGDSEAW